MKHLKNKINLILGILIFCLTIQSQAQDKKTIVQGISISNFMADHISDSQINVTIDYNYSGKKNPKDFVIYAFPKDDGGNSMARNINTELTPVKTGNNQATFVISKRNESENFTSKSIEICILEIKRKVYCKEFVLTKSWKPTSSEVNIISFEASKTQINTDESVILTWQTENATKINILQPGTRFLHGSNDSSGTLMVKPDKTTSFVLLASQISEKGSIKQVSKSVTITVGLNSTPEILTFNIEPQNISKGDPIRFYWEVKNAQKVQLYDSFGEIESRIELPNGEYGWPLKINGSYTEYLNKTESYILKVTNHFGDAEKIFKVTVKGKKID